MKKLTKFGLIGLLGVITKLWAIGYIYNPEERFLDIKPVAKEYGQNIPQEPNTLDPNNYISFSKYLKSMSTK